MNLKNWLKEDKYDVDFIYEGLILDLSYYLKQFMAEKGLNKKQLAEKMGVSPAYITKIFSGENISLKTVAKILAALEIDAGIKIFDREKNNYKENPDRNTVTIDRNKFVKIRKGTEYESNSISIAA